MHFTPARPRPASNLELYSWFFMRISAVGLVLLAGFHLFYMHIVIGVDNVSFKLIAMRWESPFWRIFDLFLLLLGWLHCTNGVRIVLDDYVHHPGWRVLTKTLLYILVLVVLVLGAYVVLTFRP